MKKEARKPRKPVPMRCGRGTACGEVVERYGAVIGDIVKVAKEAEEGP